MSESMAKTPNLVLYVDIVSPFAYLAYYVVRVSCDLHSLGFCLGSD